MMSSHIIKSTLIIQGIVFFVNNLKHRSLFNFNYADFEDGY
jgi:hypothetical protein